MSIDLLRSGLKFRDLPMSDWAGLERHFRRYLASRVKGLPVRPMPHGRAADHLWNYFPESALSTHEEVVRRLKQKQTWLAFREEPGCAVVELESASISEVPFQLGDVYLCQPEFDSDIIVYDHEMMGPFWIRQGERYRAVEVAETPLERMDSLPGVPLEKAQVRRVRQKLVKGLRECWVSVPTYRLAASGIGKDNLWNYLPRHCETELKRGCLSEMLFLGAEKVLIWSETEGTASIAPADQAWPLVKRHPNTYYFDWPDCRWVLAVPDDYIQLKTEAWCLPCLVILNP